MFPASDMQSAAINLSARPPYQSTGNGSIHDYLCHLTQCRHFQWKLTLGRTDNEREKSNKTNCIFLLSVASFKRNRGQRIRLTLNVSKPEFKSGLSPDPRTQHSWLHILLIMWRNSSGEAVVAQKELSEPKYAAKGLVRGRRQSWLSNG